MASSLASSMISHLCVHDNIDVCTMRVMRLSAQFCHIHGYTLFELFLKLYLFVCTSSPHSVFCEAWKSRVQDTDPDTRLKKEKIVPWEVMRWDGSGWSCATVGRRLVGRLGARRGARWVRGNVSLTLPALGSKSSTLARCPATWHCVPFRPSLCICVLRREKREEGRTLEELEHES